MVSYPDAMKNIMDRARSGDGLRRRQSAWQHSATRNRLRDHTYHSVMG